VRGLWTSCAGPVHELLSAGPLLAAIVGGTVASYAWDDDAPLTARVCLGAPLGLALFGLFGLLLAGVTGVTPGTAWTAAACAASPVFLLVRRAVRERVAAEVKLALVRLRSPGRSDAAASLFALGVGGLLWILFDRAAFEDRGGLYTGIDHNIGDLPFHVGIIGSFAYGGNLPPEHTELAGVRLTYPILADFVTALLLAAGMTLRRAMLAQNLALAWGLAGLVFRFATSLTGDRVVPFMALPLLFLSGGLGFALLPGDLSRSGLGLGEFLQHLPRDYTITSTGELRWGNALTTLLIPQRSLLLGAPLAVAVWTLWWSALSADASSARPRRLMAGAGLLAGLLPLAHLHGFLVVLGTGACVALIFHRPRTWAVFFVPALALAAPQAVWLAAGSAVQAGSVWAWQIGWDRGDRNPVWFWFTNTGMLLPLLGVALWRLRRTPIARFYAPFLLLFLVPNVLRLSPWIWDNIKFFFFWHVASVPLVAGLLLALWRNGGRVRWLAPALAGSLVLSGSLDVWRVASRQIALEVFDAEAVAFGSGPLRATPPRALILHAPTHNSPVYLAGRRSLLGYPGHIWSQGLDEGTREPEIARIYAGAADAGELVARHGVDYILVGPQERAWTRVNESFLSRYALVAASGPYRLLKTRGFAVDQAVEPRESLWKNNE
jgi:hypothetical protein